MRTAAICSTLIVLLFAGKPSLHDALVGLIGQNPECEWAKAIVEKKLRD